ncbi:unnamed protein product [Trichogramma brassicae]|uniref:Uncharacterized protein n=1 Tax=Trichogramma brassicae TaxID=86971 RepID=A0A6H5I1X6_9HYME|nr:unnamed protein product [Trichogramma brassicae]
MTTQDGARQGVLAPRLPKEEEGAPRLAYSLDLFATLVNCDFLEGRLDVGCKLIKWRRIRYFSVTYCLMIPLRYSSTSFVDSESNLLKRVN